MWESSGRQLQGFTGTWPAPVSVKEPMAGPSPNLWKRVKPHRNTWSTADEVEGVETKNQPGKQKRGELPEDGVGCFWGENGDMIGPWKSVREREDGKKEVKKQLGLVFHCPQEISLKKKKENSRKTRTASTAWAMEQERKQTRSYIKPDRGWSEMEQESRGSFWDRQIEIKFCLNEV